MKKILIKIGAVVFVVAGLVAVLWPVDNWRLYDADWQPLAMTEAENYCAGRVFAESGFANTKNDPAVDACVEASDKGDVPSIRMSQTWFCQGATSVVPGDCLSFVQAYRAWGLQHGGITYSWNSSNPYPVVQDYDKPNIPSREGRDGEYRNDGGRN